MIEADLGTPLLFVAGFGWPKPVPVDHRNVDPSLPTSVTRLLR